MRVALVHDWLDTWGGGEAVLAQLLEVFPAADLYTLVDLLPTADRARLPSARIVTSLLQFLPRSKHWFRYAAVLYPQIIERFDLSAYDVVVSDSHAVAKGVITRASQVHVCYCHTPARFAWTMPATYSDRASAGASWRRPFVERAFARFRAWDRRASTRVDRFIANSRHIAAAIARCYGRDADVIYPPVDVDRFVAASAHVGATPRGGEYVTVSRLVPYKRVDVLVEAFRMLPERRLIVIGDGPERSRLEALGVRNVEFIGASDDAETARRVALAKAFLIVAEEDFGIAPVEAQAAGTPVIAYGRGGARESVRGLSDAAPTGVFFDAQTPPSVIGAIAAFEAAARQITAAACRDNARRFAPPRFRAEIAQAVEAACAAPARPRPIAEAA